MMFLDLIDYAGATWSAFLRSMPEGGLQLVFRTSSSDSPVRGCICLLPHHLGYALHEAGPEREILLEQILAGELGAHGSVAGQGDHARHHAWLD